MVEEISQSIPVTAEVKSQGIKKSSKEKILKIGAIILITVTALILVLLKITRPETPTKWIIIPGAVVTVVALAGVFWNKISQGLFFKRSLEGKLPGIITQAEAFKIVKEFIESDVLENHIKQFVGVENYNFGGNTIYEFRIIPVYKDVVQQDVLSVFINANEPGKIPTFVFDSTSRMSKARANRLSNKPEEEEFDIEETKSVDPLTGREVTTRKKISKLKKQKEKTEEKTEI